MCRHRSEISAFFDPPLGLPAFDVLYRLRYEVCLTLDTPRSARTMFGENRQPPTCCICGLAEDAIDPTTGERTCFTKDAHTVPEALGNRWLFSREECDACNAGYGRTCENELGKLLMPLRSLNRVRGKNGVPKTTIRTKDAKSYLGGEYDDVVVDSTDDSVTMTDLGNNSVRVTARLQRFRPMDAARSLGKTAWLMLDAPSRATRRTLLEWIKGSSNARDVELLLAFYPAAERNNCFEVALWERRSDDRATVPGLLLVVRFGNAGIIWGEPRFAGSLTTIAPPMSVLADPPVAPTLFQIPCSSNELVESFETNFVMTFRMRTSHATPLADLGRQKREEVRAGQRSAPTVWKPMDLIMRGPVGEVRASGVEMTIQAVNEKLWSVMLRGGELGTQAFVVQYGDVAKIHNLQWLPAGRPDEVNYMGVFESCLDGGSLLVRDQENRTIIEIPLRRDIWGIR